MTPSAGSSEGPRADEHGRRAAAVQRGAAAEPDQAAEAEWAPGPELAAAIERAAAVLLGGGLVAFPTETVYGLGADATNPPAVERVYAVKGRPPGHPLIAHLPSADWLDEWAGAVPPAARLLAGAFWPGPLTLLVPRSAAVPDVVTGGRATVGLRLPSHPVALALLAAVGRPVAAPSANRFGHVSPTTAAHVRADLGDAVDLVLDGGPSEVGLESTIVDCTTDPATVLRPGAVTAADLARVLGGAVATVASGPSRAPGMLPSHYAPRAEVVLTASAEAARARAEAEAAAGRRARVLDPGVPAAVWAHDLYAWLRAADDDGVTVLVVVPPPEDGVGAAVNDRLRKAAAPRP